MRYRKNRRENNLASVTPEKAIEDEHNTAGICALYCFFEKHERQNLKIELDEKLSVWSYENSRKILASGRYMYAVGKNGAMYVGDGIAVHSQFKSGKDVQSAGWLSYVKKEDGKSFDLMIDNCSGHYTPSLSQFLQTLRGLHHVGIIPDEFKIRLSKFTKIDTSDLTTDFWTAAVAAAQTDVSPLITVSYQVNFQNFSYSLETQNVQTDLVTAQLKT